MVLFSIISYFGCLILRQNSLIGKCFPAFLFFCIIQRRTFQFFTNFLTVNLWLQVTLIITSPSLMACRETIKPHVNVRLSQKVIQVISVTIWQNVQIQGNNLLPLFSICEYSMLYIRSSIIKSRIWCSRKSLIDVQYLLFVYFLYVL